MATCEPNTTASALTSALTLHMAFYELRCWTSTGCPAPPWRGPLPFAWPPPRPSHGPVQYSTNENERERGGGGGRDSRHVCVATGAIVMHTMSWVRRPDAGWYGWYRCMTYAQLLLKCKSANKQPARTCSTGFTAFTSRRLAAASSSCSTFRRACLAWVSGSTSATAVT